MLKKIRKHLLISILAVVGAVLLAGVSFAAFQTKEIDHEMLNTGVVFVWSDGSGNWQNGLNPGGPCNRSFSVNIGKDRTDVSVKAYNGSNFSFGDSDTSHWNETVKCTGLSSYNTNYVPYSTGSGSISSNYDKTTGKLTVNQTVTLSSSLKFDVAYYVSNHQQQYVYDYLGDDIPSSITDPMNQMLTDSNVQGFLYFCPLVINYTEVTTEEVPDPLVLEANLMLPPEGETDTPYTVKDITLIPQGGTFQSSKLEVSDNGGATYTQLTGWPSNTKNADMEETQSIAGTYKYRLTVYLKDGTSDTDEKSIVIADKTPEINVSVEAHLVIPEYTYEGHKFPMQDESIFTVTDEDGNETVFSAQEAYAMGIARSNYTFYDDAYATNRTDSSDYDFETFNDVKGEGVFYYHGMKSIKLEITIKSGEIEMDTATIEM
jgi:hypothetical protein